MWTALPTEHLTKTNSWNCLISQLPEAVTCMHRAVCMYRTVCKQGKIWGPELSPLVILKLCTNSSSTGSLKGCPTHTKSPLAMAKRLIDSRYLRKSLSNYCLTKKQADGHQTFRLSPGKSPNKATTINSNNYKSWVGGESDF